MCCGGKLEENKKWAVQAPLGSGLGKSERAYPRKMAQANFSIFKSFSFSWLESTSKLIRI
jgi:hypothetical protein